MIQAIQGIAGQQANLGGIEAGREGDALQRFLQAQGIIGPELLQLGGREREADAKAISDAFGFGGLEREIGTQQSAAEQQDFLRRQGLAEVFALGPGGASSLSTVISGLFTPRSEGGKK